MLHKKIILIAGPTASGKSKLAVRIAKKINGEIINADSMQVYKEFSILSSRPKYLELKMINHHLYGFISAKKYFSTGTWLELVKETIDKILRKKKIPIIVGGTGLYFNAITKGISKIPEIDQKKRKNIRELHDKIGQTEFYKRLIKIDPLSKNKISQSDSQRTIRAFEVKMITKKSLYKWISNTKSDFLNYDIKKIFLNIPRDQLLKKIEKRTEQMLSNKSSLNEVKNFIKLEIDKSLSANKLIGVKEITEYLNGNIDLDRARELINIKTRQYAKSQNTWCRGHMMNLNKVYYEDSLVLLKKVLNLVT